MYTFKEIAAPDKNENGATNNCPHGQDICYCHYIQVQGLLGSFYPKAITVDEVFVCSYFYALVLYRKVLNAELSDIAYALDHHLLTSRETYDDVLKRLSRCVELDEIMAEMGDIMRSHILFYPSPELHFRLGSAAPDQSVYYREISDKTRQLDVLFRQTTAPEELQELNEKAISSFDSHAFLWKRLGQDFAEVLSFVHDKGTETTVSYEQVVPETDFAGYSDLVLTKHHLASMEEGRHSNDQLNFIIAHEAFEVWFPSLITALVRTINLLTAGKQADTFRAAQYIWRTGALFQLFARMIAVPQTMSASDYVTFRGELRGGSGAESIQFRAVELLIGLRDPQYAENIEKMNLMTPELRKLWDSPSLADAVTRLLIQNDIFAEHDSSAERAKKIAQEIMKPTGQPNPHADILEVLEAAIDLEQKRELWQHHHIAMVQRMIGNKLSVGVGGTKITGKPTAESGKMPNSMPYLQKTLTYQRIFPDIWNARDYLQENWQVVPVSWQ